MAGFAVSFRIESEGNYNDRWASIIDAIRKESSEAPWEETTSFLIIHSDKTADAIASSVYLGSSMTAGDLVLVLNLSFKDHAVRGNAKYPYTLASLMAAR